MQETRRRITEAAVELHGTVGPARTTVSAVAERAGVQRHTLYRHFPDDDALLAACSHRWAELNPLPDQEGWRAVEDPVERLETGLGELYGWYEQTEPMLVNLYRDAPLVEAVATQMRPLHAYVGEAAGTLASGWPSRRKVLKAAVRHAVDFHTWRSLARTGGVSRAQAVALARGMVESAAR